MAYIYPYDKKKREKRTRENSKETRNEREGEARERGTSERADDRTTAESPGEAGGPPAARILATQKNKLSPGLSSSITS